MSSVHVAEADTSDADLGLSMTVSSRPESFHTVAEPL